MDSSTAILGQTFRLPQYTHRDGWIYVRTMPFIVVLINWVLLDTAYFTSFSVFIICSLVTLLILTLLWLTITWLAVTTRERFRGEKDLAKRLFLFVPLTVLISWLALTILFKGMDQWVVTGYPLDENRYYWALLVSAVINVFVTLLHEGISGFEKWKATLIETEELKKEYMQSQLLGLKSQVNPHFLFNSLSSLSCLIHDNKEKAESFIDEMSKVYRYLLRSNEEKLVPLETELQFAHSYFHLLKARHGEGISLETDISEKDRNRYLPPLTLQILLETAFQVNQISRDNPLRLRIRSLDNGWLEVSNSIQKKFKAENPVQTGLENITNKYRLLCRECVNVTENEEGRVIQFPLMDKPEHACLK